ncbi:unnamed protein product [Leptidea sinapis]|uniref:Uncharacterized protein n=1 Tax=Leptidea sinapis TaxID=189913 RepID=A0A5E4QAB2_9NEOP|nr:unnamed protein product [Leptidea sinapis]
MVIYYSQVYELYPNKFLTLDESRVYVLNTLFNLPETYLIAWSKMAFAVATWRCLSTQYSKTSEAPSTTSTSTAT